MQTKPVEKYFFFGLLVATLIFTFLIFRPFWIVLLLGVSFSIVLFPVYEWFIKIKFPSWLASLVTVFIFIIILCGPLLSIGVLVFKQSESVYHIVVNNTDSGTLLDSVGNSINKFLPNGVVFDAQEKASSFISYVSSNIASIFSATIYTFFSFILILLIIFNFLKDGKKWKKEVLELSPLDDKDDEKIISRLVQSVNAVLKGYLFIAFVQGTLMGFGLWLFNVPNPVFWGLVAGISSLIPTIGTALVSIPAVIFLFFTGNTGYAVGLLVWAIALVGMIDNFLSPLVIGKQINIPSILIMFSVLGGISFFGPIGVLIGPLSLSLLLTLVSIYKNEFKQNKIL